jgi:MOSC domain-containing protein YiiM
MTKNEIVVEGIAIRSASRGPMKELDSASISTEIGLEGDFRGKPGPRQVTVLSVESWQAACGDLGTDLPWTQRRANLLIRGTALAETTGAIIQINDVVLEISFETTPCERMEEQHPNLRAALKSDWRGGVCCRVLSGGQVRIGDRGVLEPAPETDSGVKSGS